MANPSSRLVMLQDDRILDLGNVLPGYGLPQDAATLREAAERASRPYMQGRLLLVTNDLVEGGIWYEHPAGLSESGEVLTDSYTRIRTVNPTDFVKEILRDYGVKGRPTFLNGKNGVIGVYIWRSEPDDPWTIGDRNPRSGNIEGPTVGIGYIHIERNPGDSSGRSPPQSGSTRHRLFNRVTDTVDGEDFEEKGFAD